MPGRSGGGARPVHVRTRRLPLVAAGSVLAVVAGTSVTAVAAAAAPASHPSGYAPLTSAMAAQLSRNLNQHVIVIMNKQFAAAHVGSRAARTRASMVAIAQAPLMNELRAVHATHVKPYRLVNSFAATVSKGEVSRLKANPAVKEVIADVTI